MIWPAQSCILLRPESFRLHENDTGLGGEEFPTPEAALLQFRRNDELQAPLQSLKPLA